MTKVVAGVDIGTGSTKGVLVDLDGVVVASAQRDHRMFMPRSGWAEMDAERDWWGDVAAVCRDLAGSGHEIAGVCVSGLGPAVLAVDDRFVPISPAVLYGIDSRAVVEIEEMTAELGEEQILQRCGKGLSSQAVGPKLRWLRRHAGVPDDARWCSSHSFVVGRLTGRWVLDHHTASQCDPLYDVVAQDWARDWAEQVLPGSVLPDLVWPGEQVGVVSPEAARETALPAGIPVMAGTVDAWAEAFSAGVRRPGDLMLMYGSTMFLVQVLPAPTISPVLWTTSGVEAHSHTLAAGMSTSGSLTQWVSDLVGADFGTLVAEAARIAPGSDGLVLLPYFAGERTPLYDPDARGVVAGLTLRHTRAHLFRAAYEGIAFGVRQIIDVLDGTVGTPARIFAVGGGTQGGLWTQIVSDVCGVEQVIPEVTIGASYGDALLAAIGAGLVPAETSWAREAQVVRPDPAAHAVYQELYRVYRELYPATKDSAHSLAAFQAGQG